jgi:hypothetical protein
LQDLVGYATEPIDDTSTGKLMEGCWLPSRSSTTTCARVARAGMRATLELARSMLLASQRKCRWANAQPEPDFR